MRRTANWVGAVLVLAAWALALVSFPALPATIPMHFDAAGRADGFGPKASLLLLPGLATVMFAILYGVQYLDPRYYSYPFRIPAAKQERAGNLVRVLLAVLCALTIATLLSAEAMVVTAVGSRPSTVALASIWTCVGLIVGTMAAYLVVLYRTCR